MKIDKETKDKLVKLFEGSLIGEDGLEYPNPNPKFVHVGPKRLSLEEQVERILRKSVSEKAQIQEFETYEEAEDFDVPDEDPLPMSGFEHEDMVEELPPASQAPTKESSPVPGEAELPQDPGEPVEEEKPESTT